MGLQGLPNIAHCLKKEKMKKPYNSNVKSLKSQLQTTKTIKVFFRGNLSADMEFYIILSEAYTSNLPIQI